MIALKIFCNKNNKNFENGLFNTKILNIEEDKSSTRFKEDLILRESKFFLNKNFTCKVPQFFYLHLHFLFRVVPKLSLLKHF